ncbi:MAG: HepT-like ribonuclease domain-containing protein [Prolixibacteraceae bacterium]
MFDRDLAYDLVCLIIENLETIRKRTAGVLSADDFSISESGMILLDSVCMKLVAVGESIKNLDKITNKKFLNQYPQINWKQAMGMRDIIVHHYFDVDAEEIHKTLKEDIPLLLSVLEEIKNELMI